MLILTAERSRSWMEEVAEIINGLMRRGNRERGLAVQIPLLLYKCIDYGVGYRVTTMYYPGQIGEWHCSFKLMC
jgi:hypothetical protein